MDTSWIELPSNNPAYIQGVVKFIKLARENLVEGRTRCPCKRCKVDKWFPIEEVEGHILFNGFHKDYKNWIYHGNGDMLERILGNTIGNTSQGSLDDQSRVVERDDIEGLLRATFGVNIPNSTPLNESEPNYEREENVFGEFDFVGEFPSNEAQDFVPMVFDDKEEAKYKKLLQASEKELYDGCKSFSKLSFLLHLFHLKAMHNWTAESFSMLLKLLVDAFPFIMEFPLSYYEGKKIIKDFGLGYETIHACPNNCILYWGDFVGEHECPKCHTSRYKTVKGKESDRGKQKESETIKISEPTKVVRYFPLIPRLKRIYMSAKTAENMRWHDRDRVKDGKLRHPADAIAWREFDVRYPEFASDSRNVRLGLASDGFNPYRLMNTTYSTWPVVLIPYNLPPWLCMKPSSYILSMIIPGKSSPRIDIDVYLQLLLHELKLLWEGVDAFDAYSGQYFKLRASLTWTINDFPAYAMLSGWSTKGYMACPVCCDSTYSYSFGGKICYLGHRKWLPSNHPYRSQGSLFDGMDEYGCAPCSKCGSDILGQQEKNDYVYGQSKKPPQRKRKKLVGLFTEIGTCHDRDDNDGVLWSKRSIFFDLPYWEYNRLRHNLDVMHIEKNVCDNLLGTLLNMDKNNRDDVNARKAIQELGIKEHLWLQPRPNSRDPYMPPASYTMSIEEKERFLKVLQKLRVPDGYGSSLSRCVNMKQRKLQNLKSHDNHILMQDILPIALRASKATKIIDLLEELSCFFKDVCSTTLDPLELDEIQSRLVLTLCKMEMEFLPTFFTIMVHLLIHLVDELKLGGPVHYRWMYPIERYLAHLKTLVRNKAQPEGSIAEGYLLEETIVFSSRYLDVVETIFNRRKRNDDKVSNLSNYLYNSGGRVVGMEKVVHIDDKSLKQAHRYILLHSDEIKDLREEFINQKYQDNYSRGIQHGGNIENEWIIHEFSEWLQNQVHDIDASDEKGKLRKVLAGGLNNVAKRMTGYMINGYKFLTVRRKCSRKTQNSGVMVEADGEIYYGRLIDIYEFDYYGAYRVVMFRCDWVDITRGVKKHGNGGTSVNFSKLMHTGRLLQDDPFIFSSQAKQVFYVEDEMKKGWFHVSKTKPRDLFDLGRGDILV